MSYSPTPPSQRQLIPRRRAASEPQLRQVLEEVEAFVARLGRRKSWGSSWGFLG